MLRTWATIAGSAGCRSIPPTSARLALRSVPVPPPISGSPAAISPEPVENFVARSGEHAGRDHSRPPWDEGNRAGGTGHGISILRQLAGRALGVDLTDDVPGALEHELQLAADGDELPSLGDPALGVGGGLDVESAGDTVAGGGLADPASGSLP